MSDKIKIEKIDILILMSFLKKKLGPWLVSVRKQVFMGLTLFSRSRVIPEKLY